MDSKRKAPKLLELCIATLIKHTDHLRDVSEIADHLLERFLPHCTAGELAVVEDCTQGRDINPITNDLWKKFYTTEFGVRSANSIIQRMENRSFKWMEIYKTKTKEREEATREILKRGYAESQKHIRQTKIISSIPPTRNRRKFGGGSSKSSNLTSYKSPLMRKAKIEHLTSPEVINTRHVATERTSLERASTSSLRRVSGVPGPTRPCNAPGSARSSNSNGGNVASNSRIWR